ncbi:hypothetical protein [Kitasatospora sp. NPDC086791]|uniref:hypothetical protein n=1 Tax=Kitasatospora sp. NPDC086791 TaxID=3155178 RepID=UPI0034361ED0
MDHLIIPVVGSRQDGDTIHIDMTDVSEICFCKLLDPEERPITPCPLDEAQRTEALGRVAAGLRALQGKRAEEPEAERETLCGWGAGDYVSWDVPHVGVATVRITGTGSRYNPSLSYESWDGVTESVEGSAYMSLADKVRRWRRATAQERARFDDLATPAPANWF